MAANRLDQLIEEWDPRLRKAFLDGVYRLRSRAQISAIAERLERGDIEGAIRAVGLDPASFRDLDRAIGQAYEAGGEFTTRQMPVATGSDGLRLVIQFSVRNFRAEEWLRTYSSDLIRDIVDDQRVMVRQHLVSGMQAGANPRTTALDLVGRVNPQTGRREGGVIGLTASQEEWVRNYEAELSDPSRMKDALNRNLRDKRFDSAVNKAIRDGEPIPAGTRDAMVRNYRNRALRYRAETIARTESMRSLHAGQDESIRQAIESGAITRDQVEFIWRATSDKRTRDTHREMNGQRRKMGLPFESPSGARLEYPGDPSAPIAETANCRCWRETRIDFLRGIR